MLNPKEDAWFRGARWDCRKLRFLAKLIWGMAWWMGALGKGAV